MTVEEVTVEAVEQPENKYRELMKCPIDVKEIYEFLPHGYPFRMLDRVVALDADHGVALKCVSANEWWYPGHYPDNGIMPGVLILEAMSQLCGMVISARFVDAKDTGEEVPSAGIGVLAGAKHVRFKEMVRPGDQLRITSTRTGHASWLSEFRCEAYVGRTLVADATISVVA